MTTKSIILCNNCNCFGHGNPESIADQCPKYKYAPINLAQYCDVNIGNSIKQIWCAENTPLWITGNKDFLDNFKENLKISYRMTRTLGPTYESKTQFIGEKLVQYWMFVCNLHAKNVAPTTLKKLWEKLEYAVIFKYNSIMVPEGTNGHKPMKTDHDYYSENPYIKYILNPFIRFNMEREGILRSQNLYAIQMLFPDIPEIRDLVKHFSTDNMLYNLGGIRNNFKSYLKGFDWIDPIKGYLWDYKPEPFIAHQIGYSPLDNSALSKKEFMEIIETIPENYELAYREMQTYLLCAHYLFEDLENRIISLPFLKKPREFFPEYIYDNATHKNIIMTFNFSP